ncbi:MAG: hypothetical protein WDO18_04640 [Acidobacteriota bacterium]
MAFCNQCGKPVGEHDRFCAGCGATQSGAAAPRPPIDPKQMATLCYIPWIGWIASAAILATGKYKKERRVIFHAFQGLFLFIAWLLVDWVVKPMFGFPGMIGRSFVPGVMHLVIFIAWVIALIKTHQGEDYHLPVIGELAEKSAQDHTSSHT